MKNYLTAIVSVIFLNVLSSFNTQTNGGKEIINWDASRKLEWSDFKGQPDTSTSLIALTSCNVAGNSNFNQDSAAFTIEASFDKNKSWVKTAKATPEILRHEQIHFDIAELHARKLRRAVKESRFSLKTINKQFSDLSSKILTDFNNMQVQYDKETNHSINKERQAEWEKNVSMQLKELEAYNLPAVNVYMDKK